MLVGSWARNAHLAAVKEMVAWQAGQAAEGSAEAASETAMREALFQLHRLIGSTVEIFGSNPLLLASALLILKRQAIDPTPICISANYASWDDKQHAAEITDAVEKRVKACRESLGEADFALLLRTLEYEFEDRESLVEYDALWGEFDQASALIQREEEASGKRREWESRRDRWMPNRVLSFLCRLSLGIALGSVFILELQSILGELQVQSRYSTPSLSQALDNAGVAGFAAFVLFGLLKIAAGVRGKKHYGPSPPMCAWPTDEILSRLRPNAVGKRFPQYSQLQGILESAKVAMVDYDRRHGVASRAEIAESMRAAEAERDALFLRYNVTELPAWD
jgi:hypothetical protein